MGVKLSSIFNEVFGPVMIGPSSSHTAGPARIGLMCRLMLPADPEDIRITFDRHGAYPATYRGQGSDYGFLGGLLGMETSDHDLKNAPALAGQRGVRYEFVTADLREPWHPNLVRIQVTARNGYELEVEAASTGGGMFLITRYQGYAVTMNGGAHEFLATSADPEVCVQGAEAVCRRFGVGHEIVAVPGANGRPALVNLKTDQAPPGFPEALEALGPIRHLRPVLPVVKRLDRRPPFTTAAGALEYAREHGLDHDPWRLAVIYESSLSARSEMEIMAMMKQLAGVMRRSALAALEGGYPRRGFLPPQAAAMHKNLAGGPIKQANLGVLNRATLWSSGVVDYGFCQGLITAAPTGGSSGVLPGAVISAGEEMGFNEEEIGRALLLSGLVGVFIDHGATFAAEMAACQAEIGSASAMAAAAVALFLGGDVERCFKSAALALQNMLGLVCDPVAGFGNVPCVNRNTLGAANAVISANMVMAGFEPFIPLDEVIQAMMSVGAMLPPELRCTGGGGLCQTATGRRVAAELKKP